MDLTKGLLRDICKLYYESDDYNVCITVGGEDEDVFRLILKYIYTGTCNLKEPDMQDMYVPLLLAAGELSLLDLVKYIQLHIIANEQSWLHENIIHVFHIVTHSTTFSLLANHCNEIDIWNYLLHWAINQYPLLNSCTDISDASSWTKKDFIELENILKDFLPFIRFFQIPGDQLYEFVWPFKKILPKQLKSQLIKFHMIPNSELPSCDSNFNLSLRVPKYKIDSLYISARHAGILRSWMNKGSKSEIKKKDVVEFKLLLRGSKDGMDVKTFHKLCDNKGPTLVLIKILENNHDDGDESNDNSNHIINKRHTIGDVSENLKNNKSDNFKVRRFSTSNIINNTTITSGDTSIVIGGYNPLDWSSSDTYKQTNDSFIFSFTNPLICDSNEYILSRVQNSQYAIRDMSCKYNNLGFGHDLWWFSGSCTQQYYGKRILPITYAGTFVMEDYEVFQVIYSNGKSKENFEEEILEESESVSGGEVKGEMKSAANESNVSNERDGSILNIGSDDKSDDSFGEIIIL
ncbi:unnamed protein product [Rhizophagus irregularis]|nr:unnamed protein product [Rhizophagus irregularis]